MGGHVMGALTSVLGRRSWLLAGMVCAGLAASVMWAVQSGASGSRVAARAAAPSPAGAPKPAAVAPSVVATNVHCGQALTASVTMNGDLICSSGTALTIQGNSVSLNLGGHQISGQGTAVYGVQIRGNSDTVTNGVVTGFTTAAVYIVSSVPAPSAATVSAIRAVVNGNGVIDYGKSTKITNSTLARNTQQGILSVGSGGGVYSGDHELNNAGSGVYLGGAKTTVTGNIANGNLNHGIFALSSAGHTLSKNTANFNSWDGIHVDDLQAVDGGGNLAKGNDYASGQTPRQCYGIVCS